MAEVDNPVARENESLVGQTASDRGSAIRVLAVDDERACCKLLALMLRSPAFSCTIAGDGEEALVSLQSERFDAVISDLHMPGMGGMELLDEARRVQPHAAFLVTTGVAASGSAPGRTQL
jgi:CheY-like chemotaxis protein